MGIDFSKMIDETSEAMANKKGEKKMKKANKLAVHFWIHVYSTHDAITKTSSKIARSMVTTESSEAAYNSGRKEAAAKAMSKLLSSTKEWKHAENGGFMYIPDQSLHGVDGTGYQTFGGFITKRTGKDGKTYATISDEDWALLNEYIK